MNDSPAPAVTSFLGRANARLSALTFTQKMLLLIFLAVVVYGFMICIDVFYLRGWIELNFGVTDDLHYYQERGQAILDGQILYKDISVESPPLINFLFVIPQAFGGSPWMYQVFFSAFALMQALLTYYVLRRWSENGAFVMALFALFSPYTLIDATWGIQDEPIVTFFYFAPVLLFLLGLSKVSTAVDTVAFWVKGLPAVIFPNLLLKMKNNKERLMGIVIAIVLSLIIFVPIMVASGESFFDIFRYYLLSDDDITNTSGGISIINFFAFGGHYIPGFVGLVITAVTVLATYYLSCRWKLDIWRSAMLTTVAFLCVFPMIRAGYFALPFFFFAPWLMQGKPALWGRFIVFYALSFLAQGVESRDVSWLTFDNSWIVCIVLMLISFLILLDMTRICLQSKCLLDKEPLAETANS